jgi:glycosyltransferase involved in cell wall biosynthesis
MNSNTRFFENSWWVPFVAKWQKTPSILTDHCAHHPTHHTDFVSWVARIVDRTIAPLVSHLYNLVTVTNKATQRFVESIGMKKPMLVYGGVDTTFFHPHKRQKKRIVPHVPYHIGEKKTLVTFVGRMIPSKGPHILYDIAINLLEKYPNVEFVFAGDGPLRTRLAEKNTSDRIHIIGPLEKTDIAQLFANSDIVVHPSLHHEGFPNVLLEAGASGCALIATDMGGTRELVKHEKSGLLVKPEMKELQTALASLLTDTKKQRTFQKSIRHLAETQFSWKKIAQQYKKLLSQC